MWQFVDDKSSSGSTFRYRARTVDKWHQTVCKKPLDQLKANLPRYLSKRHFVKDESSDFTCREEHLDDEELSLAQVFEDYIRAEIYKVASSKPLHITGLSKDRFEEVQSDVIFVRSKWKKAKTPQVDPTELRIEGKEIGTFSKRKIFEVPSKIKGYFSNLTLLKYNCRRRDLFSKTVFLTVNFPMVIFPIIY